MKAFAWDTETALIRPALLAPPMTCLSWCEPDDAGHVADLAHWRDGLRLVRQKLLDPNALFVGHNVAFDMGVIMAEDPSLVPLVFRAYRDDRVTDTMIRQQLLDIAAGCFRGRMGDGNKWISYEYHLADVARRNAGMHLRKDGFRLHYSEFRDVPLDRWIEHAPKVQAKYRPRLDELRAQAAAEGKSFSRKKELSDLEGLIAADLREVLTYPVDDAVATYLSFEAQEKHVEFLSDQFRQTRAALALHLTSAWGLRTDPGKVELLREQTEEDLVALIELLQREGLVRADGSRDTKKAAARMLDVCARDGIPVRRTASGGVSLDSDACKASGDEVLKAYAGATSLKANLTKDVPALLGGARWPIHTHFGLAETGRSTSSNPNVQNWSTGARRGVKRDDAIEIRECFVPRAGWVFAQSDYDGLELRTLAQACIDLLGESHLARILNADRDPHLEVAARILGCSYDDAKARFKSGDKEAWMARQTGKVANFGFPGGLGPTRLCYFAKKAYNVDLTEPEARDLKRAWIETLPEMRDYFAGVDGLLRETDQGEGGMITQLRSGRIRGGVTYTAACNSFFQGLGSDATKAAAFAISEACYALPKSPLYGARVVNYIHDEFIVEVRDDERAHDAAHELARIMVEEANRWLPDVPAKTEPLLMRFWSKGAKAVKDSNDRLIPWEGKEAA